MQYTVVGSWSTKELRGRLKIVIWLEGWGSRTGFVRAALWVQRTNCNGGGLEKGRFLVYDLSIHSLSLSNYCRIGGSFLNKVHGSNQNLKISKIDLETSCGRLLFPS